MEENKIPKFVNKVLTPEFLSCENNNYDNFEQGEQIIYFQLDKDGIPTSNIGEFYKLYPEYVGILDLVNMNKTAKENSEEIIAHGFIPFNTFNNIETTGLSKEFIVYTLIAEMTKQSTEDIYKLMDKIDKNQEGDIFVELKFSFNKK